MVFLSSEYTADLMKSLYPARTIKSIVPYGSQNFPVAAADPNILYFGYIMGEAITVNAPQVFLGAVQQTPPVLYNGAAYIVNNDDCIGLFDRAAHQGIVFYGFKIEFLP